MATKKKTPLRELPAIPADLVDQFVKGPMTAEAVQDLSMAFKKALIERAWARSWATIWAIPRAANAPSPSTSGALPGSTTRSSRCTPVA